MNVSGEAKGSVPPRRDASARLAGLLDRFVVVARTGRLLDVAGRLVVAAMLAMVVIEFAHASGLGIPFPAGPITVAAALGIAAWQASRRWTWPDRLATAMAIERADPGLGERISRAVAFIDMRRDGTASPRDLPMFELPTCELMDEALHEAATVLEDVAGDRSVNRSPVHGPLVSLRWPAAGLVSAVAFCMAILFAPGRLVPPLAGAFLPPRVTERIFCVPPAEPASRVPSQAVAAAGRLAEAAATEQRLASALLSRFARSPGIAREELSRSEQDWLDEVASLQAVIAEDIGRDLAVVFTAVKDLDPSLAARLASGLDPERVATLARAGERIHGNQLAAASGLITSQVRPLRAALAEWGVEPSGRTGPAFDRTELVQRRIVSAIGEGGERATGAVDDGGRTPAADKTEVAPVDAAAKPSPTSTAANDSAGRATGAATAGAGGSDRGASPTGGGVETAPADRLPAWVRAREPRSAETLSGDALAAPPRYRDAVNDYYRRLWEAEAPAAIGPSTREATP